MRRLILRAGAGRTVYSLKRIEELQDNFVQPRVSGSIEDHLEDAGRAKPHLDSIIERLVAAGNHGLRVVSADIKRLARIVDKINNHYGGDVRKVTDMARLLVVCDTARGLADVFQ